MEPSELIAASYVLNVDGLHKEIKELKQRIKDLEMAQKIDISSAVAWAEVHDGVVVTVQLGKSKWHTEPLYFNGVR